jgi:hypothetical protein
MPTGPAESNDGRPLYYVKMNWYQYANSSEAGIFKVRFVWLE